ncbi:MAG: PAS domain-containing protein, partial [Sphingomonadaceae bacterium]
MALGKILQSLGASTATPQGEKARETADLNQRSNVLNDFEQAGIGWIWATDKDGRISYISENAFGNLGVSGSDLVGKFFTDVFETDSENTTERSDRPLKFRVGAHHRLTDVTLRLVPSCTPGLNSSDKSAECWWSITGVPLTD